MPVTGGHDPRVDDEQDRLAADMLRRLLVAVERGELKATSPRGRQLVLQIEGAVAALEAASRTAPDPRV